MYISLYIYTVHKAYGRPKRWAVSRCHHTLYVYTYTHVNECPASKLTLTYRMYKLNAGKVHTHIHKDMYRWASFTFSTPFQFAIPQQIILYPEMHKINLHLTRSPFCVPLKLINRFACFLWAPYTHACKYALIYTYTHLLVDVTIGLRWEIPWY